MPFRFGKFVFCGAMAVSLSGMAEGTCNRYTIQIETVPCFLGSANGRGIAENGLVTGRYSCTGGNYHPFIWNGRDPISPISFPSGIVQAEGIAINTHGVVSGRTAESNGGTYRPFWTVNGVIQILPQLPGAFASEVTGMNEGGLICGYSTGAGALTAVTWNDGQISQLPGFTLGPHSVANNINQHGNICGWMGASATRHAFFWRDGKAIDLGVINGALIMQSNALNDTDEIAGRSVFPNPSGSGFIEQAWIWRDGIFTMLCDGGECTASFAYDINNSGQVVGTTNKLGAAQVGAASIWQNGRMRLLGTMTDLPVGVKLLTAYGINNAGQITGEATINGAQLLAFILTPIPVTHGDVNCDQTVNIDDLTEVILNWGTSDENADLNESGVVDVADLMEVVGNWSAGTGKK